MDCLLIEVVDLKAFSVCRISNASALIKTIHEKTAGPFDILLVVKYCE